MSAPTRSDYQTSVPKVFSAGDMRRGQSLVVWAIREGRLCARAIDQYLMGIDDAAAVKPGGATPPPLPGSPGNNSGRT